MSAGFVQFMDRIQNPLPPMEQLEAIKYVEDVHFDACMVEDLRESLSAQEFDDFLREERETDLALSRSRHEK